jgi:uncharacterized Tic20 family protein
MSDSGSEQAPPPSEPQPSQAPYFQEPEAPAPAPAPRRATKVKAEPFVPQPGERTVDIPPAAPPPPPPQPPPPPPPPQPPPQPPSGPPTGGAPPPAPPGATPGGRPPQERNQALAMACHLGTLIDFGFACLLFGLVPPLILWLWRKDKDSEVDYHGKESLNFQLNLLFWWVAAFPLYCCCGLGILIHFLLPFVKIVLVLVASLRTADGERYRYPFIFRLIK